MYDTGESCVVVKIEGNLKLIVMISLSIHMMQAKTAFVYGVCGKLFTMKYTLKCRKQETLEKSCVPAINLVNVFTARQHSLLCRALY